MTTATTETLTPAAWSRRGSEAETADWYAGHRGPIARADLESALSAHHDEDLAAFCSSGTERAEAVGFMVAAYESDRARRAPSPDCADRRGVPLCADVDCDGCGARAERRTCADCGATGTVTDCGHMAQPRPIAGSEIGGDPVCTFCEDARVLRREMRRVFDADVEAASRHDGTARVAVDGWAGPVAYVSLTALRVLRGFADSHGSTAAGDAEVCAALEAAGALVADA